jgi:hypothetical protein
MGKMTIPTILLSDKFLRQPPLLSIQGGFQVLMEAMSKNLDIRLGVTVKQIQREDNKVTVRYHQDGIEHTETADTLVLATSPKNWPSLGLDFTVTEQNCVQQLTYYRYPIAVYRIKGIAPKQYFFTNALGDNGVGHVALITSRDNRLEPEDGRLCTIYINLKPNQEEFHFDHEVLKKEIETIEGVTEITVVEEKIWGDYMSTLPWRLRLELDHEQQQRNTFYLGSYTLGAFEDVACVAMKATDTINEYFTSTFTHDEDETAQSMRRSLYFFSSPMVAPVTALNLSQQKESRCVLL